MEYKIIYKETYEGEYFVDADSPEAAKEEFNYQISEGKIDFDDLEMSGSEITPIPYEFPILKDVSNEYEYERLTASLPAEKLQLIESVLDDYNKDLIDIAYDDMDEEAAKLLVKSAKYVVRGGETIILMWETGWIETAELIEKLTEEAAPTAAENPAPGLTQEEINILSDGLIALITNASAASAMVNDAASRKAINAHISRLQELNRKILNL